MAEMFIRYKDDKPVAYAYGDPWVGVAMYLDDLFGYPDEETAKAAWVSGHLDWALLSSWGTDDAERS